MGYTIEQIPATALKDIQPTLDRGIVFGSSVPAEARTIIQQKIAGFVANLKKDPTDASSWFDLAIWYHTADDFEGARQIWEFLIKAAPEDTTAYDNLGRMYYFDLKDFPKAESYFKQSISVRSDIITPYIELFGLYKDSYKQNTTAAVDILITASKKFPTNPDPFLLLGGYYRDHNEIAKARDAFTKGIEILKTAGDSARVKAVQAELDSLPK